MLLATLIAAAGLYPVQLPEGQARASARLTAEIAERAQLQVAAPSGCMPDEEVCLASVAHGGGFERIVSAEVKAVQNGYFVHIREFGPDQKLIREKRAQASLEEIPALFADSPKAAPAPSAALPSSGMTVAEARSRAEFGLMAGGIGLMLAAGGVELYSNVAPHSGSNGPNALSATGGSPRNVSTLAIALAATGAGAVLGGAIIFALTPESASLQARF